MNNDLTVGEPQKILWKFCLPLFGSIVFQQLYNLADSFVVGKFVGEKALAAVGNSYEITLVFLAFAFGCNIGCSVVTSRYFGGHKYEEMKSAIATAMISTGLLCATLVMMGLFGGKWMLDVMNTPAELIKDSLVYLNIYVFGIPFVFFYNLSNGIFSALGDSKTPFYFLVCSSLANIAMDVYFVRNLMLGVAGVAWATFICQGISCVLAMVAVFRRLKDIQTNKFNLFSAKLFKEFVLIALPSTLQQSFISIGNVIIQSVINSFGSSVIAGYAAGVKLNNLVITSFTTLANGISNYSSQNLGAGKRDRIPPGLKAGLRMVWILSVPLSLLYFGLPKVLLAFFMKDPSALALTSGTYFLRILVPFYFVVSAKLVCDGVLRGSGLMKEFMMATFVDLTLRVVLAIVLSKTMLGYIGIWLAWPISWITATFMSAGYYRKAFKNEIV